MKKSAHIPANELPPYADTTLQFHALLLPYCLLALAVVLFVVVLMLAVIDVDLTAITELPLSLILFPVFGVILGYLFWRYAEAKLPRSLTARYLKSAR